LPIPCSFSTATARPRHSACDGSETDGHGGTLQSHGAFYLPIDMYLPEIHQRKSCLQLCTRRNPPRGAELPEPPHRGEGKSKARRNCVTAPHNAGQIDGLIADAHRSAGRCIDAEISESLR
jgi:hypothetical protein